MYHSQAILKQIDERLKAQGLRPLAWYDVLLELHKSPRGQLRCKAICERILLSKSNVSRLIDRLEVEELVARQPSDDDGRGICAKITPKGEQLLQETWPVYKRGVHDLFTSKLTPEELATLKGLLEKLGS